MIMIHIYILHSLGDIYEKLPLVDTSRKAPLCTKNLPFLYIPLTVGHIYGVWWIIKSYK